jgi:hypothetical protein
MFSTSRSNQVAGIIARRGVPLSRGQGSRQTILLARRTRTMKLCSFDARSGRPNRSPSREEKASKLGRIIETPMGVVSISRLREN